MSPTDEPRAQNERSTFRRSVSVAVRIDATPGRIWALLTDAKDFPRWNSTVKRIEGTIALGETIAVEVPIAPDRVFKLEVVELEPEKKMVWSDGFAPMFRGVRTYTLSETDDGTTRFSMAEV